MTLVARNHFLQIHSVKNSSVATIQLHFAQLRFKQQRVQRRAQLVRHHRHEIFAHPHGSLQFVLRGLQLLEQDLLLLLAFFQCPNLFAGFRTLAVQLHKHMDLASDGIHIKRLV